MTPSQLKYYVDSTGSNFFDHKTMRFFGDTMQNYGVRETTIKTWIDEEPVPVWELYRRHPVKLGIQDSAYFRKDNYHRAYPKQ